MVPSPSIVSLMTSPIPESHRKKSERVLVFSDLGISRAATAVMAYLIKQKQWSLKVRIVL